MLNETYLRSFAINEVSLATIDDFSVDLPIVKFLQQIGKIDLHKNVTFFVGENGTGKSTLLEAIAINYGFNPEGGSRNFNFSTNNTHSKLANALQLIKGVRIPKDTYFLRAESFYNVASNIDQLEKESGGIIDYYGGKSLHEQSHGESFFSLFLNRFFGNGLYILDEPEAALSPQRQLSFLLRLDELVKLNSQFIIATHSPIILAYPNAKIIQIRETGFKEISYKDSDHYQLYQTFLENPEYMLKKLGL
jgi:predicted ATPase